jgi:hypothetical protein
MEEMNKSRPIAASTERAQLNFFRRPTALREPPSTRYQGSKLKLLPWIWENIEALSFQSALDVFGGTGCVSYFLKAQGFNVTYNDNLRFNREIGKAVVENSSVTLTDLDVEFLTAREPSRRYDDFIARTFPDIYFTPEENQWLDVVCQNIARLSGEYKRALAHAALFQACIIKRSRQDLRIGTKRKYPLVSSEKADHFPGKLFIADAFVEGSAEQVECEDWHFPLRPCRYQKSI